MCCKKSIGLLIIRLGLGGLLLMSGITKIMHPEMADMIGSAAHAIGLTFLSTTVWFWLAAIGETLAGGLFLFGLCLPVASVLAVVIATVAFTGAHNMDLQQGMPVLFLGVIALGMGFAGTGKYSLQSLFCKKCINGECGTNCDIKKPTTPEVVSA